MSKLFLVRHGKSEWNKLGLWTGWTDIGLDEDGVKEAQAAGAALKDEEIHVAHTSALKRTHETFLNLRKAAGKGDLNYTPHEALNERHYGIHTGKNKWQVKEEVGEEAFQNIRRGWDVPIPEGETLKDVHARVVPYYEAAIKQDLLDGRNILIVAHGNTLRALAKHLEEISDEGIADVEFETGKVHSYVFDDAGSIVSKEVMEAA